MNSKSNKLYAACVKLVFLLPNVYAIINGRESYPFTPAPMFGHYIGDKSLFYDFRFIAEGPAGETPVLPEHPEHKSRLAIKRFFFDRIYGSVEKNSPLWDNEHDDRQEFEQRLSKFFRVYFKDLHNADYKSIRLDVKQYNKEYKEVASHIVGSYDLSTQHFTQEWNNKQ